MKLIRIFLWLWRLDTRAVEVILGIELLRRGTLWATGAAPMSSQSYKPMSDAMSSGMWGAVFLVVGCMQLAGIVINGNWHRSPYLRMSALIFSLMAYSLLAQVFAGGANPGAALQSATQQLLNAVVCLWCVLNISAKMKNVS